MKVLITGMSGTGKSTLIVELARRGYRAVDLDDDGWSDWVPCDGNPTGANPGHDWLWEEDRLSQLLENHADGPLFLAGCAPNMGLFSSRFDRILLLVAPLDVILDRVAKRDNNPYGRTSEERARIATNKNEIEPLLRRIATHEIETTQSIDQVVSFVRAALPSARI